MKADIEKNEGLLRKINITVPQNDVNTAFEQVYSYINNNVSIKGFRKGKVPMSKIKSLYADKAQQDVAESLVSKGYQFAVEEHDLKPLGQPHIHLNNKAEENKEFVFSAEIEVRPEIVLKKVEGLKVEKEKFTINDTEVDQVLENLQKQNAEESPILIERPAEMGDVAEIDFFGTVAGQPLEKGSAKNFKLELGSNSFIEGFEEGIVGMAIGGEVNLKLNFPEEYHEKAIAGQPVEFKVNLHKLYKKEVPELNDEFAQKMGEQFKTVDDLKDAIKKDIEQRENNRIEEDLKARVIEALVAENPVDVPEKIKNNQKAQIIEDSKQKMKGQGMSDGDFEEYKKKWDHEFEDTAAFMVKSTFLIDEIAKQQNISVTEKEVQERITMHSMQMGLPLENLMKFYEEGGRMGNLRFQLTQEKVVNFLKENSVILELPKEELTENKKGQPA